MIGIWCGLVLTVIEQCADDFCAGYSGTADFRKKISEAGNRLFSAPSLPSESGIPPARPTKTKPPNTMKLTHALLLCTTLLGSAAATHAADRKPFGNGTLPEFLKPYDVDEDGKLSVEERQAYEKAMREAAKEKAKERRLLWDTDGDGKISEEERKAAIEAMRKKIEAERAKRFDELDKDDDGFLTIEEFTRVPNIRPEIAQRILDHLDTELPKDGKISKAEFLAALKPPTPPLPPRPPVPPVPPTITR